MKLITVDEQKCTQCGLCARACPAGIIVLGDAFPGTIEKIEKDSERDFFMNGVQAKEYGLIDEVIFKKGPEKIK